MIGKCVRLGLDLDFHLGDECASSELQRKTLVGWLSLKIIQTIPLIEKKNKIERNPELAGHSLFLGQSEQSL